MPFYFGYEAYDYIVPQPKVKILPPEVQEKIDATLERLVGSIPLVPLDITIPGRRLRVIIRLLNRTQRYPAVNIPEWKKEDIREKPIGITVFGIPIFTFTKIPNYREILELLEYNDTAANIVRSLPIRTNFQKPNYQVAYSLEDLNVLGNAGNPEVPDFLQDLADEIILDIHEACAAIDNPDLWYPGVDEGITPVPDSHVKLVIAGMQRELNRETRSPLNSNRTNKLPPVSLESLPWRVQRALVERRRLRYNQFGITTSLWNTNKLPLTSIPEDSEWTPRSHPEIKSSVVAVQANNNYNYNEEYYGDYEGYPYFD